MMRREEEHIVGRVPGGVMLEEQPGQVSVSEYVHVIRREEEHIVGRVPGAVMLEEEE